MLNSFKSQFLVYLALFLFFLLLRAEDIGIRTVRMSGERAFTWLALTSSGMFFTKRMRLPSEPL